MATNILFSADKTIHGLNRDENFSYTITLDSAILPAIVDEVNVTEDATWLFNQSEATLDNRIINITPSSLGGNYSYSMLQGEPEVIVDGSGNVISVQEKYTIANNGQTIEVIIASGVAGSKRYETFIAAPQNYTVDYLFQSFGAGSVGAHLKQQMEALILGHTANTDAAQIYWQSNNFDVDNPIATLNPTRFCSSIDLSGFSAMRSNQTDDRYPISLISDRHAIGSLHTGIAVGQKFVFQKNDGTFVSTTIADIDDTLPDDTYVVLLADSITDANLKPFKLMPQHWEYSNAPALHGIPQNLNAKITEMPAICKRMHNTDDAWASWMGINAVVSNTASIGLPDELSGTLTIVSHDGLTSLVPWSNDVIGGDSGSPSFFVINGEPILLSTNGGTGGSNDSFSNMVSQINTAMNTLSGAPQGTYAVEHPDLSEFTTYL